MKGLKKGIQPKLLLWLKQKTKLMSRANYTISFISATWVNRCSEDLECLNLEEEQPLAQLSSIQTDKMTLFFTELLDHDRDDVICDQDFDNFFEVYFVLHFTL